MHPVAGMVTFKVQTRLVRQAFFRRLSFLFLESVEITVRVKRFFRTAPFRAKIYLLPTRDLHAILSAAYAAATRFSIHSRTRKSSKSFAHNFSDTYCLGATAHFSKMYEKFLTEIQSEIFEGISEIEERAAKRELSAHK